MDISLRWYWLYCLGIAGILWTAIELITSQASSWDEPLYHEWTGVPMWLGWMAAIPGAILAIVGGMVSRTRNFWVVMISIGAFYCIAVIMVTTTLYLKRQGTSAELGLGEIGGGMAYFIFPGLLYVIGGLVTHWLYKKSEFQAQTK